MSHQSELIATDIDAYLKQHEHKEMLRFLTCGSVDDGKSTLIGKLLYETKMIYEDQLAAIQRDSATHGTTGGDFDPALLTAAHRTMPFGTVLDVRNPTTVQTVRVRVNDRGPYIGNRILDLSYAAAREIGLVEPGIGEVEIRVVKVGSGEREPPVPFDVTIAESPETNVPAAGDPPPVAFPLPLLPVG